MAYSFLNNINFKQNNQSKWYGGLSLYRDNLMYDVKIKEIFYAATYYFSGYVLTGHTVEISNGKDQRSILLIVKYFKQNRKLNNDKIKSSIVKYFKQKIEIEDDTILQIEVLTDSKPFTNALYVAQYVSSSMKFRINVRRLGIIAKQVLSASGNLGCIIEIKGRINGHGISRKDAVIRGYIGRNTLKNNIDFKKYTHVGRSGCVGIKVWINRDKSIV